jgi:hypothetical protein
LLPQDVGAMSDDREHPERSVVLKSDAAWIIFTAFSAVRMVSYVPQILRIARDSNGATAISYCTWLIWLGANASTVLYAIVNLRDAWLAFVSASYAVCRAIVIVLTVLKRVSHHRSNSQSGDADGRLS